jgi:cell wall-associated NlpC family hydrolase
MAAFLAALMSLNLMLLVGCAPKRVMRMPEAVQPPISAPVVTPPGGSGAAVGHRFEAANMALSQLGTPYRWGGDRPGLGFDCSGLVQWSYGRVGINLPRVVRDQIRKGRSIDVRDLEPGDLVFFKIQGNRTSHVGIYVGDGGFVHAPRAGKGVRVDRLGDSYWRKRLIDSRRIIVP